MSENHNRNTLLTDVQETNTQRLLCESLVHPSNTYHTSLRVRRVLDRIHPLVNHISWAYPVSLAR